MEDGFSLEHATVGIVGLGLMGGSLALALKGKCARLIGFDAHLPTLELALAHQIVDSAESDPATRLSEIDLLILATPVPVIIHYLRQLHHAPPRSPLTILDLGSTKRSILRAMADLPAHFDPIGGHPLCGKERLGLQNAEAALYRNAPFIVTPLERTTPNAKRLARQLISAIEANYIETTAEEHDRLLAFTSHLPFVLASALTCAAPREAASFIGPGFRSTARLAATPSHMMMGILQSNRDNILSAIQTFRSALDEIENALQEENYPSLEDTLRRSQDCYVALTVHP
jgi:prephenate dehydrogenase